MNASSDLSIILALETSQREASVALRDRTGVIHEEPLSQNKRHDDDLLPAIDRLFARAGLASQDLRGGTVCVSIGPGGFTGLRIAVATAKMFAEALDVKLVAVPSALVAFEEATRRGLLLSAALPLARGSAGGLARTGVMVALACKNDTFWATRIMRIASGEDASVDWAIVGEPGIVRGDSVDTADIHALVADEFLPDAARSRMLAAGVPILPLTLSAASVLAIGDRMSARGETIDPLRLLPLYPREPEAVTLWNARELRD